MLFLLPTILMVRERNANAKKLAVSLRMNPNLEAQVQVHLNLIHAFVLGLKVSVISHYLRSRTRRLGTLQGICQFVLLRRWTTMSLVRRAWAWITPEGRLVDRNTTKVPSHTIAARLSALIYQVIQLPCHQPFALSQATKAKGILSNYQTSLNFLDKQQLDPSSATGHRRNDV